VKLDVVRPGGPVTVTARLSELRDTRTAEDR
jgi:hypothetical protein